MIDLSKHIISNDITIRKALERLNELGNNLTLFVINKQDGQLIGSLTDGDIRRALLNNVGLNDCVEKAMFRSFRYLKRGNFSVTDIDALKEKAIYMVPILDEENKIIKIINLKNKRSILPVDVVIMAGGKGERLKPLTNEIPKPLLKVGDKSIIERNIERLILYGIDNIYITLNYLGNLIEQTIGNGQDKGVTIKYLYENTPLGTIGSVKLINDYINDIILIMNSDLLTNIDFEDFLRYFENEKADMAVAAVPYQVNIPYAVLEKNENRIIAFKEKPTYTYYSNGGIYLIKKDLFKYIPPNIPYNATDLMQTLINNNYKIINYPILGYWLDIGRHEDYLKACNDVKHIQF
ncbi:MAG TPA: nucleotidyltransferase family protein [Bacteroidales bacterium]|nr:nucleotidyltransferase family protein [Bacteroidales bacterium]